MRTITKLILTTGILTGSVFAYSKVYKDKWEKLTQQVTCWRKIDAMPFETTEPTRRTIVRKKVFSGSLIPHKEIKLEARDVRSVILS